MRLRGYSARLSGLGMISSSATILRTVERTRFQDRNSNGFAVRAPERPRACRLTAEVRERAYAGSLSSLSTIGTRLNGGREPCCGEYSGRVEDGRPARGAGETVAAPGRDRKPGAWRCAARRQVEVDGRRAVCGRRLDLVQRRGRDGSEISELRGRCEAGSAASGGQECPRRSARARATPGSESSERGSARASPSGLRLSRRPRRARWRWHRGDGSAAMPASVPAGRGEPVSTWSSEQRVVR